MEEPLAEKKFVQKSDIFIVFLICIIGFQTFLILGLTQVQEKNSDCDSEHLISRRSISYGPEPVCPKGK